MKKIGLILAVATLGLTVNAQKNTTKIGSSTGFVSNMYGIAQERAISENMSIQTQFRFRPTTIFPINYLFFVTYNDVGYNPFVNPVITGWSNITELRIYGKDKGALKGFYWGPYLNYTSHKVVSDKIYAEFTDDDNVTYSGDVQQIMKLSNIGLGIQIGTQKVWDGGFVLDWTILGVGFNSYTLLSEIIASNTSNNFDFRNYKSDVEEAYLSFEEYVPISVDLEKEKGIISSKVPFIHFRMGLSLGFGYGGK